MVECKDAIADTGPQVRAKAPKTEIRSHNAIYCRHPITRF